MQNNFNIDLCETKKSLMKYINFLTLLKKYANYFNFLINLIYIIFYKGY